MTANLAEHVPGCEEHRSDQIWKRGPLWHPDNASGLSGPQISMSELLSG